MALATLAFLAIPEDASAADDVYTVWGTPIDQVPVVHSAGHFNFTVEFLNNWSYWCCEVECPIVFWNRPVDGEDITVGDGWRAHFPVLRDVEEGRYPVTVILERIGTDGTPANETLQFEVELKRALEVKGFFLQQTSRGVMLIFDIEVMMPIDELEIEYDVLEEFELIPRSIQTTDVPIGTHRYEVQVRPWETPSDDPTWMEYSLGAFVDGDLVLYDDHQRDPEIKPMSATETTFLIGPILLMVVGIVVVLLVLRAYFRGRDRAEEPPPDPT